MQHLLLLLLVTLVTLGVKAQSLEPELISPAGGTIQLDEIRMDWTLGDLAVETLTTPGGLLTEGFLQPQLKVERVTSVAVVSGYQVTLSPNPTLRSIFLEAESEQQEDLRIELVDPSGRPLGNWRWAAPFDRYEVDMSALPTATYFVRLFQADGRLVDTWKVIKIN